MRNFAFFFARNKIMDACLFLCSFVFLRGDRIEPVILEDREKAFSIVERSNNYVFEDDLTPTDPGGRAPSYELCT